MRQVALRPSMRAFSARLRAFSTETTASPNVTVFVAPRNNDSRQNALLGPNHQSYPLPGDVACPSLPRASTSSSAEPLALLHSHRLLDLITPVSNIELNVAEAQENYLKELSPSDLAVEMTAQPCPKLMQKDLERLFPGQTVQADSVTILNLAQQTQYNQAAWSREMETERDRLTSSFISAATSICSTLQKCGHWADFIDPASGRPFLGRFTNSALFETDDAYRKMGFRIEDLGCCKVLEHATWGSRAFVGTIFTSAPIDSQIVQDLMAKLRDD